MSSNRVNRYKLLYFCWVIIDYWLRPYDFGDFADFAKYWRRAVDYRFTNRRFDLVSDSIVDFRDFAMFANQWRQETNSPNPAIDIKFSSDPNFVSGSLTIEINEPSDDLRYYLYLDGQYIGSMIGLNSEIATHKLNNGIHDIKVVAITPDDNIVVSSIRQINIQNRLHCLTASETYKYNDSYNFSGFYEANESGIINLEIVDLYGNIIWTNSATGNFSFVVPAGILESPYNQLKVQESGINWPTTWIDDIVKKFDVTKDPNDANAQSLLVCVKKRWTRDRQNVWKEYLNACNERALKPTICLFFDQTTRENIKIAFERPNMKAIYIITDGDREITVLDLWPPSRRKIHRTFFEAWDGYYFSYLGRNRIGQYYEQLPGWCENEYSVEDSKIYFQSHNRLCVMIDACKNGTSVMNPEIYIQHCASTPPDNPYTPQEYERTSDMAHAFAISNDLYSPRLYLGWRGVAFGTNNPLAPYNSFLQNLWYKAGQYENFDKAISYAVHPGGANNCLVYVNFSFVGNTGTTFGQ